MPRKKVEKVEEVEKVETIAQLMEKVKQGEKLEDIITAKKYVPLLVKRELCNSIVEFSIVENENGLKYCDHMLKEIMENTTILSYYCDLEFGEDIYGEYDSIVESGLLNDIFELIGDTELYFINDMVEVMIESKINLDNSIVNVLASGLKKLIDNMPDEKGITDMMAKAKKEFGDFDPKKLGVLGEMMDLKPNAMAKSKPRAKAKK